uniref:Uncharacterized protein n=1 Tax=Romanomermis culicivorax TaxID=13658 RepID=A0A915IQA3_ROMCU
MQNEYGISKVSSLIAELVFKQNFLSNTEGDFQQEIANLHDKQRFYIVGTSLKVIHLHLAMLSSFSPDLTGYMVNSRTINQTLWYHIT